MAMFLLLQYYFKLVVKLPNFIDVDIPFIIKEGLNFTFQVTLRPS